jgi:hypothetical protein
VRLRGDAIINRRDQLNRNGIRAIACAGSIISRTGVQGARVSFNARIGVSIIAISFIPGCSFFFSFPFFFLSDSATRVTAPTISRIAGENCAVALLSLVSSRRALAMELSALLSRRGQFPRKIRSPVTREAKLPVAKSHHNSRGLPQASIFPVDRSTETKEEEAEVEELRKERELATARMSSADRTLLRRVDGRFESEEGF